MMLSTMQSILHTYFHMTEKEVFSVYASRNRPISNEDGEAFDCWRSYKLSSLSELLTASEI